MGAGPSVYPQNGEVHHADRALVINADFANAMTKLVPDHLRRKWTEAKIEKKKFSCSTFMMYLGIEGRYDHLPHHTIHCSATYPENLADIESPRSFQRSVVLRAERVSHRPRARRRGTARSTFSHAPVTHQHANVDWVRSAFRRSREGSQTTGEGGDHHRRREA